MPRNVAAHQLQLEAAFLEPPDARHDTRSSTPASAPDRRHVEAVPSVGAEGLRELGRAAQRPSAAELLETPGALLTRSHLRGLGLERRAIDAVFRALPVVALPGYSRPMIRAEQYLELVEQYTYGDDRVRPSHA
jgi:hypothetical protein